MLQEVPFFFREQLISPSCINNVHVVIDNIEIIFVKLPLPKLALRLSCIYRPEKVNENSEQALNTVFEQTAQFKKSVLVFGDFNFPRIR